MWEWLFQFIDPLDRHGIPYSLVGSVASSIYGEPRATNDVDLVVHLRADDAGRVVRAFPSDRFYVPPEEVLQVEIARAHGAHFNVISLEGMTKADFYPLAERQQGWFARRRSLAVAGRHLWVAAPEVVILHKLLFYRDGGGEKHLRDIRAMRAQLGDQLDHPWLETELRGLGLTMPD